jgi:hypothetical protein
MVKTNCSDPEDYGAYCWSEETKAFVLGGYFYGHAIQFITIYVAKRFAGIVFSVIQYISYDYESQVYTNYVYQLIP